MAALNALLQRLAQALDAQRGFVADAAHELRSPLTALKLQLKQLERAADDGQRRAAGEALAGGVERATRLVEQLLTLARNEPGAPAAPLQPLDLAELAREALADVVPLAAARDTRLELHADAPAPVRGDRVALAALVRNLADNAVRYAPRGARVEIRVEPQGDDVWLRVDDSGPGIAPAQRSQVFERFVRGAAAADEAAGSGLGLAIVRSIAARHGAAPALDDSPLGGLRVELRFLRTEDRP